MQFGEDYELILKFVQDYRKQKNIIPTANYKSEGSGGMLGEGYMLLFRQLVYTPENMGGWLELKDDSVRALVLKEIEKYHSSNTK